jgi:hypothetical protein
MERIQHLLIVAVRIYILLNRPRLRRARCSLVNHQQTPFRSVGTIQVVWCHTPLIGVV